jgi:hypothetical protein
MPSKPRVNHVIIWIWNNLKLVIKELFVNDAFQTYGLDSDILVL